MREDARRRLDAALSAGPATVFPAEPGRNEVAFDDLLILRGRPFFQAVERRAAEAAAYPSRIRWTAPEAFADVRQPSLAAAETRALGREIEASHPGVRIALLSGDALLEAALLDEGEARRDAFERETLGDDPEGLRGTLGRFVGGFFEAGAGAATSAGAGAIGAARDRGASLFFVHLPPASGDETRHLEAGIAAGLDNYGVVPGAGAGARSGERARHRLVVDHEHAHVLSWLLGYRTAGQGVSPSAADRHLDERRADGFAAMRAVLRERDAEPVVSDLKARRDIGAVLGGDALHWTSDTVDAVAERAGVLKREGRLFAMGPDEMMQEVDAIARATTLRPAAYKGFADRLRARALGEPEPQGDAGMAAADAATAGYVRARIAGGRDALASDWIDRGEDAALAQGGGARLLRMGQALIEMDRADANLRWSGETGGISGPAGAGCLADLFSAAGALLAGERRARAAEGDHSGAAELGDPIRRLAGARQAARESAETGRGLPPSRMARLARAAETSLQAGGAWCRGARRIAGECAGMLEETSGRRTAALRPTEIEF